MADDENFSRRPQFSIAAPQRQRGG